MSLKRGTCWELLSVSLASLLAPCPLSFCRIPCASKSSSSRRLTVSGYAQVSDPRHASQLLVTVGGSRASNPTPPALRPANLLRRRRDGQLVQRCPWRWRPDLLRCACWLPARGCIRFRGFPSCCGKHACGPARRLRPAQQSVVAHRWIMRAASSVERF